MRVQVALNLEDGGEGTDRPIDMKSEIRVHF
jgi:hypothetical protein